MKLLYRDDHLKSYTDDFIRGDGIVEIELISNQLVLLNLDDSIFEKFLFDQEPYLIENGTNEIIARKFIPNEDFRALNFDADSFTEEDKFVLIYVNRKLKKIEKSKYIIRYSNWTDYVKKEYIKIKNDNLLEVKTNDGNKLLQRSIKYTYSVKEMIDDKLVLVSTSTGCCKCTEEIQGTVKWRDDNKLLVDVCVVD